jgi:Calcineurin-like phosphoesterase
MMTSRPIVTAFACALTVAACGRTPVQEPETRATAIPAPLTAPEVVHLSDHLVRPAPARLVAIGDLHGDLDHTRRALRLAGAIDATDAWVGGKLVVVQTGDEIDRGDDERDILDEVDAWKAQAHAAGGELVALLGNHEIMNASQDFRYVTPGGLAAFAPLAGGRAGAMAPGGLYATRLAARPLFVDVGGTVFVHGGVLPKHVAYGLDAMNDELDAWLTGKRAAPPSVVTGEDGPVWTRVYSEDPPDCASLDETLVRLGAKRMVVGHTVQRGGITSACDGKVWRIDVGLSHAFGGPIEALQIEGDSVAVLREPAR